MNRIVRWEVNQSGADSIEWEADSRHAQAQCAQLGFKANSKGVATPGEKGKTPVPISLSTGESGYHGGVKAASSLLGFHSVCKDFGQTHRGGLRLWFDASAAKGIASRRSVGEIKHLRTEVLRLQQAVTTSPLSVHKILGDVNAADLGTKHFLVAARIVDLWMADWPISQIWAQRNGTAGIDLRLTS